MKKNLPIIAIIVVVVVLVVVSIIFMMKSVENPNETVQKSTNVSGSEEVPYEEIKYAFVDGVNTNELIPSVETSFTNDELTIDGVTYKSVNSIVLEEKSNYNYIPYDGSSTIEYVSNPELDYLFKEDTVLIPSYLVLKDDSENAFYLYNGECYYIPIVKCDYEEEESIVFRDNLTIFKKDGKVAIDGNRVGIKYNSLEADFETIFSSYYMSSPSTEYGQSNLYKTNLDNNINTNEYMLITASNSDDKLGDICKTFILIDESGKISLSVVPRTLGTNVGNYSNLFFKEDSSITVDPSGNTIENDSIKEFYLYDNGFKVIKGE